MPDAKITDLASYAMYHADDLLVVVDTHDTSMHVSGTNKQVALASFVSLAGVAVDTAVVHLSGAETIAGTKTFEAATSTGKGLIVRAVPSQSGNLQEWQDATGAALATIDATGKLGVTIAGLIYPRLGDLAGGWFLDYQDEAAFLDLKGASTSATPTVSLGAVANLFRDDTSVLSWDVTETPWPVVITVDCSSTPIAHKFNAYYAVAFTLRGVGSSSIPTHAKVEFWDGSAYETVYDEDIVITSTVGWWASPPCLSPDPSYNLAKFRLTLTGGTVSSGHRVALQRLMVYHATQTWDPWHLRLDGGTVYGAVGFNGSSPPSKAAAPTTLSDVITILRNLGFCS